MTGRHTGGWISYRMPYVKYISPSVQEFVEGCQNSGTVWNEMERHRELVAKLFAQGGSSNISHCNCTLRSLKNVWHIPLNASVSMIMVASTSTI
jgi:hypothetical protein